MKKVEAAFSCLSFSIAGVSAVLLSQGLPEHAYFTATGGTMMTIIAYGIVKYVTEGMPEAE